MNNVAITLWKQWQDSMKIFLGHHTSHIKNRLSPTIDTLFVLWTLQHGGPMRTNISWWWQCCCILTLVACCLPDTTQHSLHHWPLCHSGWSSSTQPSCTVQLWAQPFTLHFLMSKLNSASSDLLSKTEVNLILVDLLGDQIQATAVCLEAKAEYTQSIRRQAPGNQSLQ